MLVLLVVKEEELWLLLLRPELEALVEIFRDILCLLGRLCSACGDAGQVDDPRLCPLFFTLETQKSVDLELCRLAQSLNKALYFQF